MLFLSLLLATVITTKADVPRVNPDELHALLVKGEAVAIDVRGSVPYELGHIKDAKWLPLGLLAQRVSELPEDKLIVAYCTCKAEETSLEAAMLLSSQYGFRVAVLQGGYPAWKDAGYPIEALQTSDNGASAPSASAPTENAPTESAPTESAPTVNAPTGRVPSRGGRLAPPAGISCNRNELTSFTGEVKSYKRQRGRTTLVLRTSAGTTERLTIRREGSDDPSRFYLINGTAFTSRDWSRIERRKGKLHSGMSAIAWVCKNGATYVDWRPGTKFTGAE